MLAGSIFAFIFFLFRLESPSFFASSSKCMSAQSTQCAPPFTYFSLTFIFTKRLYKNVHELSDFYKNAHEMYTNFTRTPTNFRIFDNILELSQAHSQPRHNCLLWWGSNCTQDILHISAHRFIFKADLSPHHWLGFPALSKNVKTVKFWR